MLISARRPLHSAPAQLLMSLIIKSINLPVLEVTTRLQREECVVVPISTSSSGVSAVVDVNGLGPGSEITIWFMDPSRDKGEASVNFKFTSSSGSRRGQWEELRQDSANGQYRIHRRMVSLPTLSGFQFSFRPCSWSAWIQEGENQTILVYKVPEASDFLGTIPDDRSLSDVCLPGTHESCAMYGCEWPHNCSNRPDILNEY